MMASQLGRTVLTGSSGSPDAQQGHPDEHGTYGELTDIIDRAIERSAQDLEDHAADAPRGTPGRTAPSGSASARG